ncbi:MAG: transporter substrate-binding domain-containing protein [Opitutales bacterium]|nr:transporter substrate-binding domain-containing protein [Opitutales bacterium]
MKRFILLLLTFTLASAPFVFSQTIWEKVQDRGTLRVGMSTFVPWAMRDKAGNLIGFEIDVAKQFAEDHGLEIEFVPTAWDGIIPALLASKFDVIIGGMTITPERQNTVDFSDPYALGGVNIAAHTEKAKGFEMDDFNSRRVTLTARRGTTAAKAAKELFPKARLRQFDDDTQAFQEVLNGRAHAALASSPKPEHQTVRNSDTLYLPFDALLFEGGEGMAFVKKEPETIAVFNTWIEKRLADGWLKERRHYWFGTLDWADQTHAE